jgi:glycosyltransferase involved in cell wall biosynthesis
MITKNGAQRLPKSLGSIKALADEIILVDTGSKDESKIVGASLGAKVYDFQWIDDFSAAKNYAFSKASGDWILELDDDEIISEKDYDLIRETTKRLDHKGFYLIQRNYTSEPGELEWTSSQGDAYTESSLAAGYVPRKLVRLFKNDPRIKSEGRVHETTVHTIEKIGTIGDSSIAIHHFGSITKNKEKSKHYIEIQKQDAKQDFYSYYQIASQLHGIGEIKESIDYLMKSINLNSNFHLSWLKLGIIWMQQGLIIEAKPLLLHALKLHVYAPTIAHLAIIETAEKNFKQAIVYFEKALQYDSKNADIHYNFSQTLTLAGYPLRGKEELSKAAELNPYYKTTSV